MKHTFKVISESEEQTEELACSFATLLQAGDKVALEGNLGAGKTVFARGLARGLEITDAISSPTFAIVQEYEGKCVLYHIDLYRLSDLNDALNFGLEDYIEDPEAISVIEWPSRIEPIINDSYSRIYIDYLDDKRQIRIESSKDLSILA